MEKPVPKDDEVLIAVHATTVSTADCDMRNFTFVALATKSLLLSWEKAVAIPFGANTALYFLRDLGNIQARSGSSVTRGPGSAPATS